MTKRHPGKTVLEHLTERRDFYVRGAKVAKDELQRTTSEIMLRFYEDLIAVVKAANVLGCPGHIIAALPELKAAAAPPRGSVEARELHAHLSRQGGSSHP